MPYQPLREPPTAEKGWPSTKSFETFHSLKATTIPPGAKLYRIVDPTSKDNSICWMREEEFKQLKSKSEWREKFGVWAHWNANGEYVTYTVPDGPGLNVWEGITASQRLDTTDNIVNGGATQLVIDPSHLDKAYIGNRQITKWKYDELGTQNNMIGVPVLKNNFV